MSDEQSVLMARGGSNADPVFTGDCPQAARRDCGDTPMYFPLTLCRASSCGVIAIKGFGARRPGRARIPVQRKNHWISAVRGDPADIGMRRQGMSIQQIAMARDSGSHTVESGTVTSASIVSIRRSTGRRVQGKGNLHNGPDFPALLRLVADKRDRSAFIELYEYFAPRVKSFLLGQGVAPAAADDVLQEVMNQDHPFCLYESYYI